MAIATIIAEPGTEVTEEMLRPYNGQLLALSGVTPTGESFTTSYGIIEQDGMGQVYLKGGLNAFLMNEERVRFTPFDIRRLPAARQGYRELKVEVLR